MLYVQGKTMRKMHHSEQSFLGVKYKQANRFNFQGWRYHVQFILTALTHLDFQSRKRLHDQTEASKCQNDAMSLRERTTLGVFNSDKT